MITTRALPHRALDSSGLAAILFIGVGVKLAGAVPAASLVLFVLTGIVPYLRKS